jgi:hypothetical protein
MRVLYKGLSGEDVQAWENFLVGINPASGIVVDGIFDDVVHHETIKFQIGAGLKGDGVVGSKTVGKAMSVGFNTLQDDRVDENSSAWPAKPSFGPITSAQRDLSFGKFAFTAAPTNGNPEAIKITDGWDTKNIIMVQVPQLKKLNVSRMPFHKAAVPQLESLFAEWESAGLIEKIKSFGGSWVPRFVRGSRTHLSNHAWGTAFDINVQWNMLGSLPALKEQAGSVRELVQIANANGFYWGGHFYDPATGKGRADGMHFEIAYLK